MKKHSYILMLLAASGAMLFSGCSDNDEALVDEGGYSSERLFMPMFRTSQNTNTNADVDPYGCGKASEFALSGSTHVNDMWLNWYEVKGASGYRLQGRAGVGRWDNPSEIILDTILPAGTHSFLHEDLAYGQGYCYAIQALSPRGEQYNSKWYGKGDSGHQKEMSRDDNVSWNKGSFNTGERYPVPNVFFITGVTENTLRVQFNTEIAASDLTTYSEFLEAAGKDENGNYLILNEDQTAWNFDEIKITPTGDNPDLPELTHVLTEQDKINGYVDFEGLESNALYVASGYKDGVARYYDSNFNKLSVRMHGVKGEPIKILADQTPLDGDSLLTQFHCEELRGITRLDTVLINYMSDNSIAEGQVFYLQGGKTYYMQDAIDMTKGFTLETDPADIEAGLPRAYVYMGVGYTDTESNPRQVNFNLCRPARSSVENGMMFTIDDIVFRNINFGPQRYITYSDINGNGSGNYFINMNSQGLSFSLTKLEISNCTMNGLIRGFIRFQGPNQQVIGALTVDNCVFYECGDRDSNGRGYAWFAGPGNQRLSNFFQNLTVTNSTFIDSPRHSFVGENGQLAWPSTTRWNIVIENNTFVNMGTPKSSNKGHGLFIETRSAPTGSTIAIRKNLFVFVRKGDTDLRTMYMKGMYVENQTVNYDICDNYSTYVPAWGTYLASDDPNTTLADGIFTHRAFSNTTEGAGFNEGSNNVGGMDELRIKFGDNRNGNEAETSVGYQLKAEELFRDPQPLGAWRSNNDYDKNMYHHNVDGFYYNTDARVQQHPIVTRQIGDQRWATGKPWK